MSTEIEGGRKFHGVWMPEAEAHMTMVMEHPKRRHERSGRLTYQHHKLMGCLKWLRELKGPKLRRAIDVGGHVGHWSMWLAEDFAWVDAFEPSPLHCRLFRQNMKELGRENFELHEVALGEVEATCQVVTERADDTGNTFTRIDPFIEPGFVPIHVLDSYQFPDVDFIKIDTEGSELPILKGGWQTIERCRPILCVEQKDKEFEHFGRPRREALTWLQEKGARVLARMAGDYVISTTEI